MNGNRERLGWGLRLEVLRRAGYEPTHSMSWRFPTLVLVGIVDYRHISKRLAMGTAQGEPTISYVPRFSRVFEPSGDKPPVWLVLGRGRHDDQFLMPGDLATGQPDTGRWANGGNFADGDSRFTDLVGHHAVRIHDYDLDREAVRERERNR